MKNIVFIIGNGFDLAQGFSTSYRDFYESDHCPKNYPARLINHLNSKLGQDLSSVKWYDFENELLNYYIHLQQKGFVEDVVTESERDFLRVLEPYKISFGIYDSQTDVLNMLMEKGILRYIQDHFPPYYDVPYQSDFQFSAEERDKKAFQLIKDGLKRYLSGLIYNQSHSLNLPAAILNAVLSGQDREGNGNVNVYSFNYTPIPTVSESFLSGRLHYVHGNLVSDNIIIGTQDYEGISKEYDFLQKSFDSKYAPPALVYDLQAADEVIVFGHSLGVNDRQYFKSFFKKQSSAENPDPKRKTITIFTRDEQSEVEIKRSLQQMSDNNLASLYGMNDLKIIKTSNLRESQHELKAFLERHLENEQTAEVFLGSLLG